MNKLEEIIHEAKSNYALKLKSEPFAVEKHIALEFGKYLLQEAAKNAYYRDGNGMVCTSEENRKSITSVINEYL